MVIVKLKGGLGNQLFEYAFGRRIAIDNNLTLKLDKKTGFVNDFYKREYSLFHFNITENFATQEDIVKVNYAYSPTLIGKGIRFFNKLNPFHKFYSGQERFFHFDQSIIKPYKKVYLDGHWQSEKYFKSIEDTIRSEFTIKEKPDEINQQYINKISDSNSVSIHIRRADYVNDPKTFQAHGACSLEYYYSAVKKITQTIKDPQYFVFSDDPKWAKENLKINSPTDYITHNGAGKDYEDLRLMTLCKHNILANSTFSWWGGWLNNNPDKMVFAPKKWFNKLDVDTKDLIPESWHRI